MKCFKCGFDNVDNAKYCINCGSRLDGMIICPKCGEVLPNNANVCSKCGRKIPHNEKSNENNAKIERKEQLTRIFARILNAFLIVAFALGLLAVWSKYVNSSNTSYTGGYYAHYYLFLSWGEMKKVIQSSSDAFIKVGVIYQTILNFIIVLLNVVITYVFGIMGIIKSAKNLKRKVNDVPMVNLAVILVSNLICSSAIVSCAFDFTSNGIFNTGEYLTKYITLIGVIFLISFAFLNIILFSKKSIPAFIEKLLFALAFFFAIFIILALDFYVTGLNGYGSLRTTSLVFYLMKNFGNFNGNNYFITSFVLSLCLSFFKFIMFASIGVFIIFFTTGYYSKRETHMSYKIPCYAMAILGVITSTAIIVISFVLNAFLNKMPVVPGLKGVNYHLSNTIWKQFVLCLFFVGFVIASFVLSRQTNHDQKLAENTTKI